ncbi:Phosphatidylinositol 4-kinase lsb6 [Erysiphe neolycopersici]|uniref:Phosphatidylinositol 4-kinase n=1 Tax=Erysiphe neolycopersici TaxID=212602 RepID=A0A420HAF4_9PEZI|nr:Phosphatidylinositol 4-kinase lsb6 [Erysiphe neolycopersici]
MPRDRPQTTGYARIAQAEEEESDLDDDLVNGYASIQPASLPQFSSTYSGNHSIKISDENKPPDNIKRFRIRKTTRSNSSGVDVRAINARLERWADEITSKFKSNKVKGKTKDEEKLEIYHSVFQAPDGIRPAAAEMLALKDGEGRMSKQKFDEIVESVRVAIEKGIHPKMITQGSSGSYFARNTDGKIVGVFKPKDEEPYAAGNHFEAKWNKWIHRNLFPCFFGRACLIPNLSYVSEAAAYTLDCRLRTHLVPFTDIVHLSSKSFHYDFWHRRNFIKRKKPFPPKVGSFQVFLEGYKDANIFLREHAWPDNTGSDYRPVEATQKRSKVWETCRDLVSDDEDDEPDTETSSKRKSRRFSWTDNLKQSFREELEKLVVLDYIMRNTDRGLDNWMIKVDHQKENISISAELPPQKTTDETGASPSLISTDGTSESGPYRQQRPMKADSTSATPKTSRSSKISIGAIDNSLSWPWKHPDAWRSFPFGWLFLPVSLIGQPFSKKTRDHFLPLLTSKQWWSETQMELRKVFSQDVDFKERMFARQIAVMKGQAWNVVETLKMVDHGPLELTRRARVCVWDDLVDIPIAIPMKMPSGEMRRRHDQVLQEEMDISAANSSVAQPDLSGLITSPCELPNANRFELACPPTGDENCSVHVDSTHVKNFNTNPDEQQNQDTFKLSTRPSMKLSLNRMSYDGPSREQVHDPQICRRFSFNYRTTVNSFNYGGEDLEGDLGYAAAEGMEGNHLKVIVERLETVKSKNPVFTWC